MSKLIAIITILLGGSVIFKIKTVGDYDIKARDGERFYFANNNWTGNVSVNGVPVREFTGVKINYFRKEAEA